MPQGSANQVDCTDQWTHLVKSTIHWGPPNLQFDVVMFGGVAACWKGAWNGVLCATGDF